MYEVVVLVESVIRDEPDIHGKKIRMCEVGDILMIYEEYGKWLLTKDGWIHRYCVERMDCL